MVDRMSVKYVKIYMAILSMLLTPPALAGGARGPKKFAGWTYVCHFGKYGEVTIDGNFYGKSGAPEMLIVVNGVKHTAYGGAYFYQANDDDNLVITGPPDRRWLEYNGVRDSHCKYTRKYGE